MFVLFSCIFMQSCGHLLGKGWPLGSLVCEALLRFRHFPMWCPWSGVVLDCTDSSSLHSSLLYLLINDWQIIDILNKTRKLCLRGFDKRSKHFKTFEFHNSIMCPFVFIMTLYLGL